MCVQADAPSTFVVANGEKMVCDHFVLQLEWGVQGQVFRQGQTNILISVWNLTCDALFTRAQRSGLNGCLWQNTGTTLLFTLPLSVLLLR
jgi:hypothetical protein